jgi:hypothetical protein
MTWLTLCRFDEKGTISRHEINIFKSEYIAISHVWCRASWHRIPTIPWKFLASPQKARWISQELPKLVSNCYFLAQQQCMRHWKKSYPNGIEEIWLDRIWPLQEIMLSSKLQFTLCQLNGLTTVSFPNTSPRVAQQQPDYTSVRESKALNLGSLYRLCDTLHSVAEAWTAYGLPVLEGKEESVEEYRARHTPFIEAVLNNSEIERVSQCRADRNCSPYNLLEDESKSQRKTSKARDFIHANLS